VSVCVAYGHVVAGWAAVGQFGSGAAGQKDKQGEDSHGADGTPGGAVMPTVRIPLFGSYTPRSAAFTTGGDQQFLNCVFEKFQNPLTGQSAVKVYKRPSWASAGSTAASAGKALLAWTGLGTSGVTGLISAFDTPNSTLYRGTTSIGAITGVCNFLSETFISGTAVVVAISSDNTGWYYPSDAGTGSPTFSGDTTNGSAVVNNIASTAGMYSGQSVSGTGIPASTRILTVDSGTQITMNANATATGTVTITRSPIAKILDADFPGNAGKTIVGNFAHLDGYAFILTQDGRVYQSDLNSITSWGANNYLTANQSTDTGVGLIRYKNRILAFGTSSMEVFRNVGNSTGSVLLGEHTAFSRYGAAAGGAILNMEDTIAWVGSGDQSGVGVYILDGLTPKKISDAGLDLIMSTWTIANVKLGYGSVEGKRLLFLLPSTNETSAFVYDMDLSMWSIWVASENSLTRFPFAIATSALGNASVVYGVAGNSASIWAMSSGTWSGFNSTMLTRPLDFGTSKRKIMRSLTLIGDTQVDTQFTVEFSDNDFSSFGTSRALNTGPSSTPSKLHRLGQFVKRAIRVTATSAQRSGLEAIEIDYEECSS
jgi:hypothetical protein